MNSKIDVRIYRVNMVFFNSTLYKVVLQGLQLLEIEVVIFI